MNKSEAEEAMANATESGEVETPVDAANESAAEVDESNPSENEESKEEEQTDWQDRYLRLYAEFDNFRKRTMRERVDLIRNASRDALEKMLPILDDFSRAQAASVDTLDADALKEGQALIYNKLKQTLAAQGVSELEVKPGDVFDVDLHEAITRIPAPDQSGKIVDVVEAGYKLNDVVIRYAKVVVGE